MKPTEDERLKRQIDAILRKWYDLDFTIKCRAEILQALEDAGYERKGD